VETDDNRRRRYARQTVLPEIGEAGQARLSAAKVLVVGAGGLGSPLLLYLAAAGVGTVGVVDADTVDLGNLHRQIAHTTDRVGTPKVESAARTVAALNPEVRIVAHQARLSGANAAQIVAEYDLVADGSDNFPTRYLVNDACYLAGKPLVSAALLRFDGQVTTFKAHEAGDNPCYRCVYPSPPPPGTVPSCAEAGILGAVAGALGCLQATEVLKELLGIGDGLSGRLMMVDALGARVRELRIHRDPACALCGAEASIRDLSRYGG